MVFLIKFRIVFICNRYAEGVFRYEAPALGKSVNRRHKNRRRKKSAAKTEERTVLDGVFMGYNGGPNCLKNSLLKLKYYRAVALIHSNLFAVDIGQCTQKSFRNFILGRGEFLDKNNILMGNARIFV